MSSADADEEAATAAFMVNCFGLANLQNRLFDWGMAQLEIRVMWQKWLCLHNVRVANRAVRAEIPSLMSVKTKELHARILELEKQLQSATGRNAELFVKHETDASARKSRDRKVMANTLELWVGRMNLRCELIRTRLIGRWRLSTFLHLTEKAAEKVGSDTEKAAASDVHSQELSACQEALSAAEAKADELASQNGSLAAEIESLKQQLRDSTDATAAGNSAAESARLLRGIALVGSMMARGAQLELSRSFKAWQIIIAAGRAIDRVHDEVDHKASVLRQVGQLYWCRCLLSCYVHSHAPVVLFLLKLNAPLSACVACVICAVCIACVACVICAVCIVCVALRRGWRLLVGF